MRQNETKFLLTLPVELKKKLKKRAEENGRTLTREIVQILKKEM